MNTSLQCIPCFFQQLLATVQSAAPGNEALHQKIVQAWARTIADSNLEQSPPALAGRMYALVAEATGCDDLFAKEKQHANKHVLELLPRLRRLRDAASNPLKTALELSIIGNSMDCGAPHQCDWEAEIEQLLENLDERSYQDFAESVSQGKSLVILGDNAGEIVLDQLLVEVLLERGCDVTYAVRGRPIINDATMEDARMVGMTELCHVVSSGVDTPGTVLDRCTPDFLHTLDQADLVLSKGQGNYEALCTERPDYYYAFKVKCPVVEKMTGFPLGHSMFWRAMR